ncbi:MAG: 2OG-Fe dioxygenase family protein [Methyloceanibacter sp.]
MCTGRSFGAFKLTEPLDAVFLDDRRVLHGVTPIAPVKSRFESISRRVGLKYRSDKPSETVLGGRAT